MKIMAKYDWSEYDFRGEHSEFNVKFDIYIHWGDWFDFYVSEETTDVDDKDLRYIIPYENERYDIENDAVDKIYSKIDKLDKSFEYRILIDAHVKDKKVTAINDFKIINKEPYIGIDENETYHQEFKCDVYVEPFRGHHKVDFTITRVDVHFEDFAETPLDDDIEEYDYEIEEEVKKQLNGRLDEILKGVPVKLLEDDDSILDDGVIPSKEEDDRIITIEAICEADFEPGGYSATYWDPGEDWIAIKNLEVISTEVL